MKIKIYAIGFAVIILLVGGIIWKFKGNSKKEEIIIQTIITISPSQTQEIKKTQTYTLEDMGKHQIQSDCWMVIGDGVYDVTQYVSRHPGGKAILEGCGKDATTLFETRPMGSKTPHSQKARDLMITYKIGTVLR